MLDDMASSDPEQYKKFVETNIKNGAQEMLKEKQNQEKELSVRCDACCSLKVWANLKSESLISQMEQKLSLNLDDLEQEKRVVDRLDKRVKFYINILRNERVLGAYNKLNQETEDPKEFNLIPLSISKVDVTKSQSFGTNVYNFDIVINDEVYKKINKILLQQIVLDTVQRRIQLDRNPIQLKFYKCFYQFEIASAQQLRGKLFKTRSNRSEFNLILLLEEQTDKQLQQKHQQQQVREQQKQILTNIDSQEIQLGSKLPEITPQFNKKVLIEEINQSEVVVPYQMTHEKDKIIILLNPKVDYLKDLDLNVSETELKLETITKDTINIKFDCKIDNQNISAKWDKKKKQLKLILNKI